MSLSQIQHILSSVAEIIPMEKLIFSKRHRFIFPFWHVVSDIPPTHLSQLYRVPSTSDFVRDLDFFQKNFTPASVGQVVDFINDKNSRSGKYFFPTFDDGLSECFYQIAPILKEKGICAAFFINPEFVDNKMLFHRHKASLILNRLSSGRINHATRTEAELVIHQKDTNKSLEQFLHQSSFSDHVLLDRLATIFEIDFGEFLAQKKPYMTLDQIKQLQADGFLIGAHSMSHPEFFNATEDEMSDQIISSLKFLINEIHPTIKSFAFPFTDFRVPDSVFDTIHQSGLCDLSFGTAGIKDDRWRNLVQRIPMESFDFKDARQLIRTEYLSYLLKIAVRKNKVRRQ